MKSRVMIGLTAALACSAASPAVAQRKSPDLELSQIESHCQGSTDHSVAYHECLGKAVTRLRAQLGTAVRRKLFEIGEVAQKSPGDGGLNGREDAEKWKRAFNREQATWSSYVKQRCNNVVEFDSYGGSGAAGFAASCEIKLMLQRVQELQP